MSWLKSDDNYPNHPKVKRLTDKAYRLNDHARHYCARNLTDGALDVQDVRVLLAESGATKRHVTELHEAGLWDRVADGYLVHDFLDYNPGRDQVMAEREKAKERMRRIRSGERDSEREDVRSRTPSRPGKELRPLSRELGLVMDEARRAALTEAGAA